MIFRYTGWSSLVLLVFCLGLVWALPGSASMRVSVLGVPATRAEEKPSKEISELLGQVLKSLDGVEQRCVKSLDPGLRSRVEKIIKRCGTQADCQSRLARLMNTQVFVLVRAQAIGDGVVVNLQVRDMGSGVDLGRLSRTMAGSFKHKKDVLEAVITDILFPERMIGRVELNLEPSGGNVFLDGQLKVSDAPASVNLEAVHASRHTLVVKRDGYRDFIAIIQVPFKGVSQIDVKMKAESGSDR